MKLLIIGSKGFIGTHAFNHFKKAGIETFGCDVVVEYNDRHYFQVDATNASYDEIFSSQNFDACINCSGAANVSDSFVNPLRDYNLNSRNVFVILEAIRKHQRFCKFINISSAAVYGNPQTLPVNETVSLQPLSPYGWHKFYAEKTCQEFYDYFNLPTCSIRVFSAYGPGLRKQLFWDWYQKINQAKFITLFGTGNESRDFIFIDDLMEALACVLHHSGFKADVINVANGQEIYIKHAIEVFKKTLNNNIEYEFNGHVRPGDPINWRADISKLVALGYSQKVSFETGIDKYVKWLNEKE